MAGELGLRTGFNLPMSSPQRGEQYGANFRKPVGDFMQQAVPLAIPGVGTGVRGALVTGAQLMAEADPAEAAVIKGIRTPRMLAGNNIPQSAQARGMTVRDYLNTAAGDPGGLSAQMQDINKAIGFSKGARGVIPGPSQNGQPIYYDPNARSMRIDVDRLRTMSPKNADTAHTLAFEDYANQVIR